MTRRVAVVACRLTMGMVTASLIGGCAAHAPRGQRFVQRGPDAAPGGVAKDDSAPAGETISKAPRESLESFIEKTRQLAAAARPPEQLPTIERQDAELSSARLLLSVSPVAEHHRRVAVAYLRLGVLDSAYDHFKAALRLDPSDAASFDGLARIWRDWGLPNLALGDAHRAIYYAPSSAIVHNTLGTILQKLGQTVAARSAFEAALRLDPNASYALNNLCYVLFLQGHFEQAIRACQSAAGAQPSLAAAHNNLGLAYWASGDRRSATEAFASGTGSGGVRYNTGIVLLGSRQYWQAAQAFDDAGTLAPALPLARQRARQARALAASLVEGRDGSH